MFETFLCVIVFSNRLMSPLSKDKMCRDSSLALMTYHYTVIKTVFMYFCLVVLAVRMVADVTETHNVIPSLEFKT